MKRWNRGSFKTFVFGMLIMLASSAGFLGCTGRVYTVIHPQGVVPEDTSYAHVTPQKKCTVTGTLTTDRKLTLDGSETITSPCKFEGLLAYQQDHFTEIYWTTSVLQEVKAADDSKKKIVIMTYDNEDPTKRCKPRIETKQAIRADYSKPYQLLYSPGLLEKYTFKADFDSGVLKSINAESTPDRGETVKNIATAMKELFETAKKGTEIMMVEPSRETGSNVTRCTDEPLLQYIVKTSKLCPEGSICKYAEYEPWEKPVNQTGRTTE
jgi:hypothetical protein